METNRVGIEDILIEMMKRGGYGFDNAYLPALWF